MMIMSNNIMIPGHKNIEYFEIKPINYEYKELYYGITFVVIFIGIIIVVATILYIINFHHFINDENEEVYLMSEIKN